MRCRREKLAECTKDVEIIIKTSISGLQRKFCKIQLSRDSYWRKVVLRRSTLKLAECTKDIKIIKQQEVWVVSVTFWKFRHSSRIKLVVHRRTRKLAEWTTDIKTIIKPATSALHGLFWKIESMSGVHSTSLFPAQRRTHFAHYISLKNSSFRNVPGTAQISCFVMNSKSDTFSLSLSLVPNRTNF